MKQRRFVLILVVFLQTSLACIFLNDCPEALRYIREKRYDPETLRILQSAHCGVEVRNGRSQTKVQCERIPKFNSLPEGCVPIKECPAALELIQTKRNDPTTIQLLRSLVCAQGTRNDLIFCRKLPMTATVGTNEIFPTSECGLQAPGVKITKGQRAEFEDFPWLALLQYKNESNHLEYRCHASLISKRYVMTAAHCLQQTSAERRKTGTIVKIVLGEYNLKTAQDCIRDYCTDPLQEFQPESVVTHPNFGSAGAVSDIGLIRLNKDALFSDYVKPICLPQASISLSAYEAMWIAGWGKTENKTSSDVKLKAKINYLTDRECSQYNVDQTQICAGSTTGADTCKGDSGGPLMINRRYPDGEERIVLVGVVSFGGACGSGAAIYTKVANFVSWIGSSVQK